MPLVVKSGTAIDEALKLRGLRPKDIDRVLLVGGTSKIPLVRRYVSEKLAGKEPEPFDRVDPMTCVAQGAAIVSAILQGAPGLDNYAYSVKLEHSLCANPVDQRTNRVYLDPIIKRGVDIPCSFTKTYYPVADPAERVIISVYEGDVYDNPESPENVKLAEIPWEFKPPRPQRDGGLEVTFEYGDDGILTVQIQDQYAGQKKRFAIQQTGEDQLDAAQLMKMKEINEELINRTMELESTQEFKDAVEVLKKTEQDVIPRVENPEDRRELEDLCRQVRQAMGSGDRKKMEEAGRHAQRSAAELRVFAVTRLAAIVVAERVVATRSAPASRLTQGRPPCSPAPCARKGCRAGKEVPQLQDRRLAAGGLRGEPARRPGAGRAADPRRASWATPSGRTSKCWRSIPTTPRPGGRSARWRRRCGSSTRRRPAGAGKRSCNDRRPFRRWMANWNSDGDGGGWLSGLFWFVIVLCALIFGYFIGQYVANHPTPTTANPPNATATVTPEKGK